MVELNHNVANVNADATIKANHGVVVGVKVTKAGASGSKIQLRNGTGNSDPIEFTVFGETVQDNGRIHRRFENGIRCDVTGDAEYLIVFK